MLKGLESQQESRVESLETPALDVPGSIMLDDQGVRECTPVWPNFVLAPSSGQCDVSYRRVPREERKTSHSLSCDTLAAPSWRVSSRADDAHLSGRAKAALSVSYVESFVLASVVSPLEEITV